MSKLSQQVENQLATSAKVVVSARAHAKTIAIALAERAALIQGPGSKAHAKAHEAVLLALADALDAAAVELRATELAYTAEQADDVPLRAQRDVAHVALVDSITRVRSAVEDAFGREGLKTYGLQGETPRKPHRATLNHVANVIHLLEKKPASVDTEFGTSFDTASVAKALRNKLTELEVLVGYLDREARELELALAVRDRAAATWSDTYQGVANALTGMYRLAGWKELAERVRPSQRIVRGDEPAPEISGAEPPAPNVHEPPAPVA
ncbi:MAG: hypothetical protein HUU21_22710 [Polyangiaceae bacterium]|nr:hypothetical protein [Polyangiaceae bacterium]